MKHFNDETTINQNMQRERKEEVERKSESKEKIKDKRKEKDTQRTQGGHVMKSRLVPYICYLINYILLYGILFPRNYILFMQRFVSLGKNVSQQH